MRQLMIALMAMFAFTGLARADEVTNREMNEQIWVPFIQSYAEGDGDLHASLYSDQMVRVSRGRVQTGKAYIERVRGQVDGMRERGGRAIAFRFTERSSNEDAVYETGVFRIMRGDGTASYGQFEIVARKEDGRWKLTFDHDQPTNQVAWEAAEPMEAILIPAGR